MPTVDVVSKLDMQLVDNAINVAVKKIAQRYDFKGAHVEVELNKKDKTLKVHVPDDMKLRHTREIIDGALIDQGVSPKAVSWPETPEAATLGTLRVTCKLVEGIEKEHAKKVVEIVKDSGLKIKASIQADQVRLDGKQIDDLQAIMAKLRESALPIPLQFVNMKR